MAGIVPALIEWGPWALVGAVVGAYLWARHTGALLTRGEVERMDRRIEKETDRVIDLYKKQIEALEKATDKKDETNAKLMEQNAKLMSHSAVSSHALDQIMEEAKRRGVLS